MDYRSRWVRIGSVAGIAGPGIFAAVIALMGLLHPSYSHLNNFISDLGALDAPMPWPQRFNFFQFGLAIAALGPGLSSALRAPSWLMVSMLMLIGVGIFLSGVFPGHAADPTSRASLWHGMVGLPAFLLITVLPMVAGRRFSQDAHWRSLAKFSMALSPLLLTFLVLMAWADATTGGIPGLFQRLFIGTWILWMVAVAMRLRRRLEEGGP